MKWGSSRSLPATLPTDLSSGPDFGPDFGLDSDLDFGRDSDLDFGPKPGGFRENPPRPVPKLRWGSQRGSPTRGLRLQTSYR